jgi:hypothetical protein
MTANDKLKKLAEGMAKCAANGDCEEAHVAADRLLVQTVRVLAVMATTQQVTLIKSKERLRLTRLLLRNYDKTCKWFA